MSDKTTDAFNFLADKFPARYRVRATEYLQGLLHALAEGDGFIATEVEAIRDNLLVITAQGKHLDRLASIYGVTRGTGTGVQDDDFRQLIPTLGMSPKQITHSLQKVIDDIYGPYATHANVTCSAPAPYSLHVGSSLRLLVDGTDHTFYFKANDAVSLSAATALEVANAISDRGNGIFTASVVSNSRTGEEFVNVRTNTIGSQGFIQALGGDAQSALRFPLIRSTRQSIGTFVVTRYNGSDEMVYSLSGGISPGLRTGDVRQGDYVTIRSDSGFNPANTGSYVVTFVDEDSFRIRNQNGIPESGVTQAHVDDFTFYLPNQANILLSTRPATILQTAPKELTVLLPVTSPIVKRTLKGGHHFHTGTSVLNSATPTTATLGSSTGFSAVGAFHVISSRKGSEGTCSTFSSNTLSLVSSEGWPSQGAAYSNATQTFYYYSGIVGNTLENVSPSPSSDVVGATLKYSERYSYTGITGNVLTGVFPDPSGIVGLEVAALAGLNEGFIGSFLQDPGAKFIASEDETTLGETVQQGSSRTVIQVTDCSHFNDSGSVVFEFNNREQEGPVRYLGKVGSGALIIDPSHVFERDHPKGTTLRQVRQVGAYKPRASGDDYAVYLTGTSQARTLVAQYLMDIVAAGITIKFQIIQPSQKWPVLPLLNADKPTDTTLA
jgi:hypothetical protein